MKLSLDALVLLDEIERRGSFAAAAAALDKAPSSLTYAVQKLEQDLDVLLFDRSGHRARLTPAGQLLLEEGRRIVYAADDLESRVKQVAHGWEPRLTIALDVLLPWQPFMLWMKEFDQVARDTRLRFTREVLAGMWDALMAGEADLLVGAPGPGPAGGGYRSRVLTRMSFEFCVAPGHPLARLSGVLPRDVLERHRAVAIADSARRLPVRTVGILEGQPVLTVADLDGKLAAMRAGLGVGWLPGWVARNEAQAGRLVVKPVNAEKHVEELYLAWRSGESGKAMNWWLRKLRDNTIVEGMDQ